MIKNNTKFFRMPAFIISGILSVIVFAVEGICAFTTGSMPISIASYGGDCTEYLGIGWKILTLYSISPADNPAATISMISFSTSIFVFWGLVWIAILLVRAIIQKIRSGHARG